MRCNVVYSECSFTAHCWCTLPAPKEQTLGFELFSFMVRISEGSRKIQGFFYSHRQPPERVKEKDCASMRRGWMQDRPCFFPSGGAFFFSFFYVADFFFFLFFFQKPFNQKHMVGWKVAEALSTKAPSGGSGVNAPRLLKVRS